jgi:hypothetical protein
MSKPPDPQISTQMVGLSLKHRNYLVQLAFRSLTRALLSAK